MFSTNWCLDYKDAPFEESCWTNFWSKNQDVLKRIEAEAKEPVKQWWNVRSFVDSWDSKVVKYASDNPIFDLGAIDDGLFENTGRDYGVRYTSLGEYREVIDPSQQCVGLGKRLTQQIEDMATAMAPHTHWAEDDAKHLLVTTLLTQEMVEELERREDRVAQSKQRTKKKKKTLS